jgi:transglutaminase-like putative cysteine protease
MELAVKTLMIRVGCEFRHTTQGVVPAIFLVRPAAELDRRFARESWVMSPAGPYHDYMDVYGNLCRRVTLPPGSSTVTYDAFIVMDDLLDPEDWDAPQALVEDLPDDVLHYLLPSRYCLSDEITDRAWELFGHTKPGWARVQAISDYVFEHITFGYGSSSLMSTSSDVLASAAGVCRDFAHLGIAFTRAMNIPARYAFGYLPDIDVPPSTTPMDFCAWTEVFLGGRWWTFDPRNNARRRGRIVIARGRDALDTAMVTTFGNARFDGMTVVAEPTTA